MKNNSKLREKLMIAAGNTGIAIFVFTGLALYFGLSNTKFKAYHTLLIVSIVLACVTFVTTSAILIAILVMKKKDPKTPAKVEVNQEFTVKNQKREVFVVAGAIVKDGYVFAAQRGNKGETKFKWEFPGGKLEQGETPQQALARELFEELKIKVKVHELITQVVDEYPTQILHIDTYRCELLEGTPTLTEHINMAWSDKNELDKLEFSPADAPTLKKIKTLYL